MLEAMAREFYDLSGGADRIQTFRVELPSLWRNTECTAHLLAAGEGRVAAADLRVGGRDLLWGEEPHSHHHGGCGDSHGQRGNERGAAERQPAGGRQVALRRIPRAWLPGG